MIIFGTHFGGKLRKLDNQYIETKYILIMVPLIPISSMFVTGTEFNNREGYEIPISGKSLLHGYLRFFTFFGAIALLLGSIFFYRDIGRMDLLGIPAYVWGIIVGLMWTYSSYVVSEEKPDIALERKKLGLIVGVNALPEWLNPATRNAFYKSLIGKVESKYPSDSWKDILMDPRAELENLALVFTYLRYKTICEPNIAHSIEKDMQTISKKIDHLIIKKTTTENL